MEGKKYQYSVVLVLNPKTEEKEREAVLKKIYTKLESFGVQIVKKDHLGLKDLVYQIKKQNKGDFWDLDLETKKSLKIDQLNIYLNREISVIRYLILKK